MQILCGGRASHYSSHCHLPICSGNGHWAQSELSCRQKSSSIWSKPCWCATVFRNSCLRESFPKRRVAAVSSRLFDNCAGSFAYSAQRRVLGGVEASALCAIQNGNSTLARISATRDSPISAIFFGD